jgi:hypothetical protein
MHLMSSNTLEPVCWPGSSAVYRSRRAFLNAEDVYAWGEDILVRGEVIIEKEGEREEKGRED